MLDLRTVLAAAVLGAAVLAPTTAAAAPACPAALPYGAAASADLLRLGALDLRPVGLPVGPVADVQLATTGAGLVADGQPAAAAAARDVAANLLGVALPAGIGLGQTVRQTAPPTNPAPTVATGPTLDLGVLRGQLGTASAHASWDEAMRCGATTGPAGTATASAADLAVLPAPGGRALAALPGNLASSSRTELVEQAGMTAARATATASLADLRLFAGSGSELSVKVVSEPVLTATASGQPDGTGVRYQAPVLEISGPGIGSHRLDAPGASLDLALPPGSAATGLPALGGDPLAALPAAARELAGLRSGPGPADRPLELAGLPELPATGELPVLGELVGDLTAVTGDLTVLRLSIGELEQRVDGGSVSASAASLRVQLLAWDGDRLTEQRPATAVLDLAIGLLSATATAPAQPAAEPPPAGGCGGCGAGGGLPVTGSPVQLLAGAGAVLIVAGGLLWLAGRQTHRRVLPD